jgi:outer membrane lipoprotein-sorting protein
MKKNILFFSILFVLFFSISLYSQNIDSIMVKYTEAVGGRSNWDAVKTMKFTGYSTIMNMDIPYTQYVKRPGKWLIEINVQGMKILQCYDGANGWMVNPMAGKKTAEKTDEETTKLFRANALIGGKLLNIKEMGYTIELAGKEDMEGTEVYKIVLTDKDGVTSNYFLDVNTNLILKNISIVTRMGTEITTESTYSNYKKVKDVMISFLLDQKLTGAQFDSQKITIDKVEINTVIDDKIFQMPIE